MRHDACVVLPPVDPASARLWQQFVVFNESGRRPQAAAAMASFIDSLSDADRVAFTYWFCRRRYARPRSEREHSYLTPLARDVVVPVLIEGARREEPQSLRWLAHAVLGDDMRTDLIAPQLHTRSRPAGLLAAALARNPDAHDLWRIAFHFELAAAEWGTHHLSESVLILPEEECLSSVKRARDIAERAPHGALVADDLEDLALLSQMLADFRAWSRTDPIGSFPNWCRAHGRTYRFSAAIYYDPAAPKS